VKTRHLSLVTHTHSATLTSRSSVLSPYGPVRAGLTTSPNPITQRVSADQALMELLNLLERKIADLNTKSFTVLSTLEHDTRAIRAQLLDTVTEETGIK